MSSLPIFCISFLNKDGYDGNIACLILRDGIIKGNDDEKLTYGNDGNDDDERLTYGNDGNDDETLTCGKLVNLLGKQQKKSNNR